MYTFRFYPRFTDSNPEVGLGNLCFNKLSRGLWCVCIRTFENYWFKLFLESLPKLLHGSVCVYRLSVFLTQGWQTIALRPNPDWSVFSVIKITGMQSHPFAYVPSLRCSGIKWQRLCGFQTLKYLLSAPLQKQKKGQLLFWNYSIALNTVSYHQLFIYGSFIARHFLSFGMH